MPTLPGSLADYCARAYRRGPTIGGRVMLFGLRVIAAIGNAFGNRRKR